MSTDELGDPAPTGTDTTPAPPRPAPFLDRRGGATLIVLLLAFGGVVFPVAGWLVGVGLLWFSSGWRRVDKLVGTFAPAVVLALGVGISELSAGSGAELLLSPGHLAVLAGPYLGAIASAIYLFVRFRPVST